MENRSLTRHSGARLQHRRGKTNSTINTYEPNIVYLRCSNNEFYSQLIFSKCAEREILAVQFEINRKVLSRQTNVPIRV